MTAMVVSALLQPCQFGVDGARAGAIGVEGSLLGVHRGLYAVVDDTTLHALCTQKAPLVV